MADTTTTDAGSPLALLLAQGMGTGQSPKPDLTTPTIDPKLLLTAVGASSPALGGTGADSVRANSAPTTPSAADQLRNQATAIMQPAQQKYADALAQGAPQRQTPKYSLLQTALGLIGGGMLNSASPFTSEGTKALGAYVNARNQNADTDYQNAVNSHMQMIDAAHQGYLMASQQAAPLTQEAMEAQREAAASHAADMQRTWESAQQAAREGNLDRRLAQQHTDALSDHLYAMLGQTPEGRGFAASLIGQKLGWSPDQVRDASHMAVHMTPDEAIRRVQLAIAEQELAEHAQDRNYVPGSDINPDGKPYYQLSKDLTIQGLLAGLSKDKAQTSLIGSQKQGLDIDNQFAPARLGAGTEKTIAETEAMKADTEGRNLANKFQQKYGLPAAQFATLMKSKKDGELTPDDALKTANSWLESMNKIHGEALGDEKLQESLQKSLGGWGQSSEQSKSIQQKIGEVRARIADYQNDWAQAKMQYRKYRDKASGIGALPNVQGAGAQIGGKTSSGASWSFSP